MRERTLGTDHADVAACLNNLAVLLKVVGKRSEAEALYQRSIAIKERALGPTHPQVQGDPTQEGVSDHRCCAQAAMEGLDPQGRAA